MFALVVYGSVGASDDVLSNRQLFAIYVSHQNEIEKFAESLDDPGTDGQIIESWLAVQNELYSIGIRNRIQKILDRLRDRTSDDLNERERRFNPDRTSIRDRIQNRIESFWRFVRQAVLILLILTWAAIMYKLW